jgi:hypothetical protein
MREPALPRLPFVERTHGVTVPTSPGAIVADLASSFQGAKAVPWTEAVQNHGRASMSE